MLVWKILSKLASASWAILKTVMNLCNEIGLFSLQKSYNKCKNQLSELQLWTQIEDSLWKLWGMLRLAAKILSFLSLIWSTINYCKEIWVTFFLEDVKILIVTHTYATSWPLLLQENVYKENGNFFKMSNLSVKLLISWNGGIFFKNTSPFFPQKYYTLGSIHILCQMVLGYFWSTYLP